jgi:hypothetical protein
MRSRLFALLVLAFTAAIPVRTQQAVAKPALVRAGRVLDVRSAAYRTDQGIWIDGGKIRQVGRSMRSRRRRRATSPWSF